MKKIKRIVFGMIAAVVLFVLVLVGNLMVFERNAKIISKGEPVKKYTQINQALLVIDIQEATTGEISLTPFYKSESEGLIKNINTLANAFNKQDLPVIYIRSEISNPLINLLNSSYARGSVGAQLDNRLTIVSNYEIVKSRNDAFFNTTLDSVLVTNQINKLYMVGLDVAHCIKYTVEAAQNRNYKIGLIKEAVLSESVEMRDSMLFEFAEQGIEITTIDDFQP
ncbi:cysteine hydrolase [uncultured Draconibacterium sp.]|uniref:cysteine hydrolase family protein n=1 Tax=uncultured Draconibacterium sp. TaxID=1573823 RepID=UPI0029C734CB|nr:cysteine hydrolase [uncultured Draconibacterium sp.]